jgi:hypothetical protein
LPELIERLCGHGAGNMHQSNELIEHIYKIVLRMLAIFTTVINSHVHNSKDKYYSDEISVMNYSFLPKAHTTCNGARPD